MSLIGPIRSFSSFSSLRRDSESANESMDKMSTSSILWIHSYLLVKTAQEVERRNPLVVAVFCPHLPSRPHHLAFLGLRIIQEGVGRNPLVAGVGRRNPVAEVGRRNPGVAVVGRRNPLVAGGGASKPGGGGGGASKPAGGDFFLFGPLGLGEIILSFFGHRHSLSRWGDVRKRWR